MGSQPSGARERLRARLRSTMEADRIDETGKGEKSNSTPILVNGDQHRHRSATVGSRMALLPTSSGPSAASSGSHMEDISFNEDDLMVIDYTRDNLVRESEFNVTKDQIALADQLPTLDCEESKKTNRN